MPSSATITTTDFTTFVAGARAKASHLNTNFSLYRGHIIPINTDTSSASDNSHDLGSDEHRWRAVYANSIDLETSTSTSTLVIQGATSVTYGSVQILIEGQTACAIGRHQSKYGHGYLSGANSIGSYLQVDQSSATIVVDNTVTMVMTYPTTDFRNGTQVDFKINGSTTGTVDSSGFRRGLLSGPTKSQSSAISFSSTSTSYVAVSGSTVTVTLTKAGNPVFLSIETQGITSGMAGFGVNATGSSICVGGLRYVANSSVIYTDSKLVIGTTSSYVACPVSSTFLYTLATTTSITFYLEIAALQNCRAGVFDAVLSATPL